MVAKSADLFTPRIPRRQLARAIKTNNLGAAILLADRICDLPDIVSIDYGPALGNGTCLVYRPKSRLTLRKTGEIPFCQVFHDRILVGGLSDSFSHELVEKGWAVNKGQWAMLHMPRDENEADICWSIIWRRYREIVAASRADDRPVPAAVRPQFSRSNHRK